MLIEKVCSVAFYCQRCGKIHVQDIPYFSAAPWETLTCNSCGHEQARLLRRGRLLEIRVGCVVCGTVQNIRYSMKNLRHLHMEKIFCHQDHFELGYIGRRRCIEELLAFNQAEFEMLHPSDGKNFIEKQQILLEAVNRVHDIAAHGDMVCPCGSREIAADIRGNSIVLECCHCGRYCVLPAERAEDLARLNRRQDLVFTAPDLLKKH